MATNSLTGGLVDPNNLMMMQMLGPLAQQITQNPAYVAQQAAMRGTPPIFSGTQSTPAAKPKSGGEKAPAGKKDGLSGKLDKLGAFASAIQAPEAPQLQMPSPGSGNSQNATVPSPDLAAVMNAMMQQTVQRPQQRTLADLLRG